MKHIWSIICSLSSIDVDSNNFSLFNCLEQINIPPFKDDKDNIIPLIFEVISLWRGNENEEFKGEILLEIDDPNGKKLKEFQLNPVKQKGKKRLRTRIKIKGLPFTEIGEYIFKLKIRNNNHEDYHIACELPLEIQHSLIIQKAL